ncbi:Lrp/AsnC family transcriptional regulator [Nanoarchaeota archaeon]
MKEKDLKVLAHFRQDARKNLTKISRDTGVPVSTLFDKLKRFEKEFIKKHTCLLDFKKLGYTVKVFLILRANHETKADLKRFLTNHSKVNSVFKINGGYDFIAEAIFKDVTELCKFSEELDQFNLIDKVEHLVMDDIKQEEFLGGYIECLN